MKGTLPLLVLLAPFTLTAQSVVPNNPGTRPTIAIRNATIHPVSSAPIQNATLVMADGLITAVGPQAAVPAGAELIDGSGLHVYPGMIDSNTRIGITEIGAVRATNDATEIGDFNPNARVAVALNPHSNLIPVTRVNGVLTVLSRPSGAIISGTSAVIRLAGWTPEEMVIDGSAGMHIQFPAVPRPRFEGRPDAEAEKKRSEAYGKSLERLRLFLKDVRAYSQALRSDGSLPEGVARDLVLEAAVPLVRREMPAFIHVDWEDDIRAAVKFAGEEDLRLVLVGVADAQRVVDLLREQSVPVLLGPLWRMPLREDDPYDQIYANASALHRAGVRFAIQSNEDHNSRNLPYQAAAAVAFGLPKEAALAAVTLEPARILGVDDRLGSLEVGKAATIMITTGDPLDLREDIVQVFIDGERIPMQSYQTLLRDKFRERNERVIRQRGN